MLTRWPPPWRLSPADAWAALETNWRSCPTVALTLQEQLAALHACAREGIGGGRVYDEMIACCALKAQAEALITGNVAHFARHAGRMRVVAPRT